MSTQHQADIMIQLVALLNTLQSTYTKWFLDRKDFLSQLKAKDWIIGNGKEYRRTGIDANYVRATAQDRLSTTN